MQFVARRCARSVYVLIAQQILWVAEPPRVQCCSLCSVVHCTAQCIQHRVGQCSVNVDSHRTLCFVFMSVDPGHTLIYQHIQLYNKSILQNSSALFHFVYSECVSDVCLIIYIAETDVRQLSLKNRFWISNMVCLVTRERRVRQPIILFPNIGTNESANNNF